MAGGHGPPQISDPYWLFASEPDVVQNILAPPPGEAGDGRPRPRPNPPVTGPILDGEPLHLEPVVFNDAW